MNPALDAAIVGGGPAGSAAAIELAARGLCVAMFEKDIFPRPKVCGEFLGANGRRRLERWGLTGELDRAGVESIREGAFFLPDGKHRTFSLPEPAMGISRFLLDSTLARRAGEAGADVRFSHEVIRIDGNLREGFALAVRTPKSDEQRFFARAVISAWGRWSPLDLAFGREFASVASNRFFGWSRHLGGESGHLAGRVHLYFFRGGYCGLSRVERGTVNFAGIVSERELRKVGGGWNGFTNHVRAAHTALARDIEPLSLDSEIRGTPMVLFRKHSRVFQDILAAGDAAGVRDPFTGDGQATAMTSGALAAKNVSEFLKGGVSAEELKARYAAAWSGKLGGRFGWDAVLRRAAFSPSLQKLALPFARPIVSLGFPATRSRS